LRNAVERAVVLTSGDVITPDYLPDALFRNHAEPFPTVSPTASLEEIEKEHIIQVLAETPILEDAAARLGINASTLWRKLQALQDRVDILPKRRSLSRESSNKLT
jgi:two-component system, NtrC family, response regulator AlgB